MRRVAMMFLLAGIPLVAGDTAAAGNANQGGPSIAKRNFSEAEIQSTLQALGIKPGSTSKVIGCDVENFAGVLTAKVKAANYPLAPVYWLRYQPGPTSTTQVRFVVAPLFAGSPIAAQVQTINPNSSFDVLTPLGIPSWANNLTAGPWVLAVQNDAGQSATYTFTVE